jgi:DNA-binding SARP family transcriptional activator/nucleoid-associated protein YgaU
VPPTTPTPGTARPDTAGAAQAGTRDAASRVAARSSGGHRQPQWRDRARRARTARPRQHRAAGAAPPGRRLRRAADVTGAAALLAGPPWALVRLAGLPLPGHWHGWAQVRESAAGPLGGGTAITVLAGAAWLLWAVFALSLVMELIAVTRGQPAPRLPAIAPVQALAAALVGAAMMSAPHIPRAGTRSAISAPLVPGHTAQLTAASETAGRAASSGSTAQVYRVREDDDLWDIAERFLGDPEEWRQIYRLNEGRPQPDGGALTDPNLILPGWVLLISQPGTGHAAAPRPGTSPPGRPGTTSPGGGRTPEPSPRPSRTAEPSARPSRTAASPGPPAGGSSPSRAAHPPQVAVRLPSGALIGIAVAVMIAAALALAAVQRRRRYRPRPSPPGTLQPDTPPLPDVITALRRAARPPLPAVGAEGGDPDAADPYLDLYEARPEPDADGDSAAAPGKNPDSVPQPGLEHPARRELPPGTVPLGIRGDDAEAAIDIAALGGLGLAGPGGESAARAILAALLAHGSPGATGLPAAIIPAADAARLLPGAEPALIPGLAVSGTLDAALSELESLQLTLARTSGTDLTGDDPPGARGLGVTLIAAPGQGQDRRLAGILDTGRHSGTAAVLLGTWTAGVTCQVAADGTVAAVSPPNPDLDGVRLYTLGAEEAAAITGVLKEAGGRPPAILPGPPASTAGAEERQPGPPPPAGRPVQLTLLGPLRITAAGQEVAGGMRKARELLAFLAVQYPDGASGDVISEALWPEADPGRAAGQRNLALRKAREMLRTATGLPEPRWILNVSGRYRLDPALIGTDLEAFSQALEEARNASGDARLAAWRRAVALYRGELAEGSGYEWAEPYAEAARRRALDAWTAIAEILQPADPDEALSALETALGHDPYNEYLYVRIMRLQAAAGRPEAVRRTLGLLESKLTDLGLTPSSQTRQAAVALLAAASAPGRQPRPAPGPRSGDGQHGQRTG